MFFTVTDEEGRVRQSNFHCGYNDRNCVDQVYRDFPINSTKACWRDPKHDTISFSSPGDDKLKGAWAGAGLGIAFLCIGFLTCCAVVLLTNKLCRPMTAQERRDAKEGDTSTFGLPREKSDDQTKVTVVSQYPPVQENPTSYYGQYNPYGQNTRQAYTDQPQM